MPQYNIQVAVDPTKAGQGVRVVEDKLQAVKKTADGLNTSLQRAFDFNAGPATAQVSAVDKALDNVQASATAAGAAVNNAMNRASGAVIVNNNKIVNSNGQVRASQVQLGQQFNDFSTQVLSGSSVITAFAQQSGQAAFALSGMNGALGAVGRFLAGPFGTVLIIAATVAATALSAAFTSAGDEADDASTKTFDFTRKLDVLKLSADATTRAMDQLASATRSAIKEQGDFLAVQTATAEGAVSALERRIASSKTALERLQGAAGANPFGAAAIAYESSLIRASIAADEASLKKARESVLNTEIAASQRRVNDSLDAGTAATNRYNEAIGQLEQRRRASVAVERARPGLQNYEASKIQGGYLSERGYEAEFRRLKTQRDAAIEAAREAEQEANKRDRPGSTASLTALDVAKLLNQRFGGAFPNNRQLTGGKHTDGSDHYKNQAVDFVPRGGVGAISKQDIRDFLTSLGIEIKRNRRGTEQLFGPGDKDHSDHFHVAFEKRRAAADDIAYKAEQRAERQAREQEQAAAEAERARQAQVRRDEAFADASARLDDESLRVKQAGIKDHEVLAELARDQVRAEQERYRRDLDSRVTLEQINAADRDILIAKQGILTLLKLQDIDRAEAKRKEDEKREARGGLNDVYAGLDNRPDLQRVGELGRIEEELEHRQKVLDEAREQELLTEQEYQDAKTAILEAAEEKRRQIDEAVTATRLEAARSITGSLLGIAEEFAGKQSGIYKAIFAVDKAFAIAQAVLALQQNIAQASKYGFPQNLPFIAGAVAQGAAIISNIHAIGAQFREGGYTGDRPEGTVAGVVHGREFVVNARGTRENRALLEAINSGRPVRTMRAANDHGPQAGRPFNLRIDASSVPGVEFNVRQVTEDDVEVIASRVVARDAGKVVSASLRDPNSRTSKAIQNNTTARRRRA